MQERSLAARTLELRSGVILEDASAIFPFAGAATADRPHSTDLADRIFQLLVVAVRDGELDPRASEVADLRRVTRDQGLTVAQVFALVYVVERAALDELALDESFGATTDGWPRTAQLVRRGSFDLLGALTTCLLRESESSTLLDPLTTLHTRPVLLAVIEKEIGRAERYHEPFAMIVVEVDHLAEINAHHGFGFGDRVLERIGIVIRSYFREHDWVSRCADDAFAILLPGTRRAHAETLAEGLRVTVEERLALGDYRTEEQVHVTVSVAVIIGDHVDSSFRAEHLLRQAEDALRIARAGGPNRVQIVEIHGTTIPRSARTRSKRASGPLDTGP